MLGLKQSAWVVAATLGLCLSDGTVWRGGAARAVEFQGVPAEEFPIALQLAVAADGEGRLVNITDWPIALSGYTLACEAGCLDESAWMSFHRAAELDEATLVALFGEGVRDLRIVSAGPGSLSELSVDPDSAVLLPPHQEWQLGDVVSGSPMQIEEYLASHAIGMTWSGVIVPEPSSAMLIAGATIAGLLWLRRRR